MSGTRGWASAKDSLLDVRVRLSEEEVAMLRRLAARQDTTLNMALRQAVVLAETLSTAAGETGKILVEKSDGEMLEVIRRWR